MSYYSQYPYYPQPYYYPPKPKIRINKTALKGTIVVIIGFALIMVSIFASWYTYDTGIKMSFSLRGLKIIGISFSWDEVEAELGAEDESFIDLADVHTYTFFIMLIAIILAILTLVLALIAVFEKLKPKIPGMLSLLCFIFALSGFVFYCMNLVKIYLFRGNFWNSDDFGTWGPSFGWYLAFVSAIVFLVAAAILLLPVPLETPEIEYQQPAYQLQTVQPSLSEYGGTPPSI